MFLGLAGLWLCPFAQAGLPASSHNVYYAIVARNVFHLMPEPPPPPPPAPPLPEITLTGIATILPQKCALLNIRFPAGAAGPAREEECILRPGEREGPIEVLAINEKTGYVRLNNSGTVMSITFGPHDPGHPTAVAAPTPPRVHLNLAAH
jgi:hypothetical protein